jgi:RNA polymerase sigma-70 factor (ECF subfamily)
MNLERSSAGFPTTRWSQVVRAADHDSHHALADLCESYWYPVYAYIRRRGHNADEAFDLTQAFFARLIEKRPIAAADPGRGRFRAFLLADCRFFLRDVRDHEHAAKRNAPISSLDAQNAESRYVREPTDNETPERIFDRTWTHEQLNRTMEQLREQEAAAGRGELFESLRPLLAFTPGAPRQGEVAATLGMSPGAVQVALHRMRARFGHLLREQVAASLEDATPQAIEQEIRELFTSLAC